MRFARDGALGIVTLDSPPLNLIGQELIADLLAAITEVKAAEGERPPFPTLAAVHGACMAGGFELALFCDFIWAADGMMLGLPETRLGIVPLAGGVERVAGADALLLDAAVGLFDTVDARGGIETFLESGAGKASVADR